MEGDGEEFEGIDDMSEAPEIPSDEDEESVGSDEVEGDTLGRVWLESVGDGRGGTGLESSRMVKRVCQHVESWLLLVVRRRLRLSVVHLA